MTTGQGRAAAKEPQKDQMVTVYALCNLTIASDHYEPGDQMKVPQWQAGELKKQGYAADEKPEGELDGSDPNLQVERHVRTQWTKEPITKGRRTPIPGEQETELVGEGGFNAASPWL